VKAKQLYVLLYSIALRTLLILPIDQVMMEKKIGKI